MSRWRTTSQSNHDGAGDDRRAHEPDLVGIGEEGVLADATIRAEDTLNEPLAGSRSDTAKVRLSRINGDRGCPFSIATKSIGGGAALLHPLDEPSVTHLAVRGGDGGTGPTGSGPARKASLRWEAGS
jgi:hypothetical protein